MGSGKGSGGGCCPGCGFICSVLCAVVAWAAFLTSAGNLFLPLWQRNETDSLVIDDVPYNATGYKGLFLCCHEITDVIDLPYIRSCAVCSDLEKLPDGSGYEWKSADSLSLYTIAVTCLAVCAIGSLLMACDRCRGCITSSIYMVFALGAFLSSAVTVALYPREVDYQFDYIFIGYYVGLSTVALSLAATIMFCQAMCTTMDLCPCC